MEEKKQFKPGDLVYWKPTRKKRGLNRPIERGIVVGVDGATIAVKLNSGPIRELKLDSLSRNRPDEHQS